MNDVLWCLEDYTEEVLDVHEAELKKLQEYYKANGHIFEKVVEREEMWKKFLAYEVWIGL